MQRRLRWDFPVQILNGLVQQLTVSFGWEVRQNSEAETQNGPLEGCGLAPFSDSLNLTASGGGMLIGDRVFGTGNCRQREFHI